MLNPFMQSMTTADVLTENDMVTHSTSGNAMLDAFFQLGAMRTADETRITNTFVKALAEDSTLAMKLLFYNRDVRGGQGERRTFRTILRHLALTAPEAMRSYLPFVPVYGRWDDLFEVFGTSLEDAAIKLFKQGMDDDKVSGLTAKWMPRKGPHAKKLCVAWELTPKQYRQLIVGKTNVVETLMCQQKWDEIVFGHVPSQAARIYRKAFGRHSQERYAEYLTKVEKGEDKINAGATNPHEIVRAYIKAGMDPNAFDQTLEVQWNALDDVYPDSTVNVLPMVDTSGSMTGHSGGDPYFAAAGLGIFLAQRNTGSFKNLFMTFSDNPGFVQLPDGGDLYDCLRITQRAPWDMNTNLMRAFDVILKRAHATKLAPNDMPQVLLILSDMEFDRCAQNPDHTAMAGIKARYAASGYTVPQIVFWNLASRQDNVPVKIDEAGTALVSGFSPSIMKSILVNPLSLTPEGIMLETLMGERYAAIQ